MNRGKTMKKPLVAVVLGTRPEAVKLAPVVRALRARGDLSVRVCATAQHRELLDRMLADLELTVDEDLDLMQPGQDLAAFCSRALLGVQSSLRRMRPDYLLVQGDTTTAFAAALAAFYERVPIGHVEAGLRSFDLGNPFPEEANRALIGRLADLHFAPTERSAANLRREGLPDASIVRTGNTVVDALRWSAARPHRFRDAELAAAAAELRPGQQAVVVTAHRRESFGAPLESLCRAFDAVARRHEDARLFFPVHPNPQVRAVVKRIVRHPRVKLLQPLDYLDLVHLLRLCRFALTDSGGIQEEAPSLGKPVVVLRDVTERPEAVEAGAAVLAGTGTRAVAEAAGRLLRDPAHYRSMAGGWGIFGDGRAGERIAGCVAQRLGLQPRRPAELGAPPPRHAVTAGSK
jgi:UDP-N-acetylglucosamine 2-epimerase (non-hydrolysing)